MTAAMSKNHFHIENKLSQHNSSVQSTNCHIYDITIFRYIFLIKNIVLNQSTATKCNYLLTHWLCNNTVVIRKVTIYHVIWKFIQYTKVMLLVTDLYANWMSKCYTKIITSLRNLAAEQELGDG